MGNLWWWGFVFFLGFVEPCALPYWWVQRLSLPPGSLQPGKPRRAISYRETFHSFNQNQFFHIKEYSEYTWWEQGDPKQAPELKRSDEIDTNSVLTTTTFHEPTKKPPRLVSTSKPKLVATEKPKTEEKLSTTSSKKSKTSTTEKQSTSTTEESSTTSTTTRRPRTSRTTTAKSVVNEDVKANEASTEESSTVTTERARTTRKPRKSATTEESKTEDTTAKSSTSESSSTTQRAKTTRKPRRTVTTERSTERNEKEKNDTAVDDIKGNIVDVQSKDSLQEAKTPSSGSKKDLKSQSLLGGWIKLPSNDSAEPCKVSEADINSLRSMVEKLFSSPRDDTMNPESKELARENILKKFRDFGLQVWTQNFSVPETSEKGGREGVNLIGVIPGSQRGEMSDGIVLVGAHYDTVAGTNGVDDNGSGLAVMLEVAKALTDARCRFNNTLMFVAFDLEEEGAVGSNHFVDQYLIPEELKRARAHFQGAFILDGIMNFNNGINSQDLPVDFAESLPGLQNFVNRTGNRGDFLAMISRNHVDNHLTRSLMESWEKIGETHYKLYNLAVNMGQKIPPAVVIESHLNFLNSDHANFWYHNSTSYFPETLNAVLLTDTGPFRGKMKECYHSKCDDLTAMSPEKLQFAKKTADALTASLVELTRATSAGNILTEDFRFLVALLIAFGVLKRLNLSEL